MKLRLSVRANACGGFRDEGRVKFNFKTFMFSEIRGGEALGQNSWDFGDENKVRCHG